MGLITNPVRFEKKLRQAQAQEAATLQPKQNEFGHVLALLKDTEKEAEQIAREILKTKGIIRAKLEQQGEEVDKRYHALSARKMKLQEALAVELTDRNIDNILEFREAVAVGLQNLTFEDRRRWLEVLQVTVTVKDRQAVIACRISSKPFIFSLKDKERLSGFTSS